MIQMICTYYNKPSANPDNTHYIMDIIKKFFLGYWESEVFNKLKYLSHH